MNIGEFKKNQYMFINARPLVLVKENMDYEGNQQINNFIKDLISCKILLRDLADKEVSYSIRNELLNIALFIVNNYQYYNELITTGELPIEKIAVSVKLSVKYLNMWKDYIIAYTLIYGNPTYKLIQDYMQTSDKVEEKKINIPNNDGLAKGIVLTKGKAGAIILTSLGEFKKVKVNGEYKKGSECEGREKKTLKDYKLYMSILLIFLSIIIGIGSFTYKNTVTTIVVKGNATIKLECNIFNMIVSADSISKEGNKLLEDINITDRELDTALYKIIEYMDKEDMISNEGIVVTISGKPMKYGIIDKTEDYIYVNNIDIKFNNSGIEHKLN